MIRRIQTKFSNKARAKRAELFKITLKPEPSNKILDLGGGNGKHINSILGSNNFSDVLIADISTEDLEYAKNRFNYKTHQLTEDDVLPFEDKHFDIVFCNSVLEHVTIPKKEIWSFKSTKVFKERSLKNQMKFANEISRIGKSYFVQTPNKYFIMESHTWLPGLIALAPRTLQIGTIKLFNRFWPKKTTPDWNLLTFKEMQKLFPEAEIHREKSFGMTKSLIAIKINKSQSQ